MRCDLKFRYAEYIIVQDLKHLVKVPDHVSLSVAAMLPTGALLAMNTVIHAREYTDLLLKERGDNGKKIIFLTDVIQFLRVILLYHIISLEMSQVVKNNTD